MPIQPINPATKAVGKIVKDVQNKQPHKTINTYEFHLGFVPQKHPMGRDMAKVEHFIYSMTIFTS